jgi:hypothetical protein
MQHARHRNARYQENIFNNHGDVTCFGNFNFASVALTNSLDKMCSSIVAGRETALASSMVWIIRKKRSSRIGGEISRKRREFSKHHVKSKFDG